MSGYTMPMEDATQDVSNVSGGIQDNWTWITFSRPLNTGDNSDFNFVGMSCAYLLYAWGDYNTADESIRQHAVRGYSAKQYCFHVCEHVNNATSAQGNDVTSAMTSGSLVI